MDIPVYPTFLNQTARYMLRYLGAVQEVKRTIEDKGLTVMATIARYACAYQSIAKPDWWDASKRWDSVHHLYWRRPLHSRSAGPVIEQATHLCDLSRYLGGEIDLASINAHSLRWDEDAGHLSKVPIDESLIPPASRIPRVTAATWYHLTLDAPFINNQTIP